ncbi:MAG: phosphatidate cytidylyltransferase [Clostridia bacterium]|nr:phosphatidate cytidylyltransferase [Clostridia bacterium]
MFLKRTLTGVGLALLIVGFIIASHFVSAIFIDMLILLFTAGAVWELHQCFKGMGRKMFIAPSLIVLILSYPTFYLMQHFMSGEAGTKTNIGFLGLFIVLLLGVMAVLVEFTFRPSKDVEATELTEEALKDGCNIKDLLVNIFVLVYPTMFMAMAWGLSYKYYAVFTILMAIALPCGCDCFAYWFGSMIKGKKLCPKISPKKTISGAVGGLVGGMVVAIIFWVIFEYYSVVDVAPSGQVYQSIISHNIAGWEWKTALIFLAIGLVGAVVGQLGDLAASRIKRAMGVKDYGKIFPGHGGVMDRLDSITFSLVIMTIAMVCVYGY